MMYNFTVERFPSDTSGYNPTALTEGRLTIALNNSIFLDVDGILLVEFAVVLARWLSAVRRGEKPDLYYASMDFEEEPIFALRYDDERKSFTTESVWSRQEPVAIKDSEAVRAAQEYIGRLATYLAERSDVNLHAIIDAAISEHQ